LIHWCPARFLLIWRTALTPLTFRTFATIWNRDRSNAVRHHYTVLSEILKYIPEARLTELIEAHETGQAPRRLDSRTHLTVLLYGQLSGARSLRGLVEELESHAAALSDLGCDPVKRSTLSEANRYRPAALFDELLKTMLGQARCGLRRHVRDATYLIDSTSLSLSWLSARWAHFSAKLCAAKAHIVFDPDAGLPVYSIVTPARTPDLTAIRKMPIEAGATYVFDLGYYDYGWWAAFHEAECRIVTRFKSHTPLKLEEERAVPVSFGEGADILSDRIGHLPERQASRRKNPFQGKVREVRVKIETGRILRILTNDLKAPAREIADLYKRRWAIELFFRWVKQNLKLRHFLGTSENAVRIQIAVALIAFVLLRLAQASQTIIESPLTFARLVRSNLTQRRRIDQLLSPSPQPQRQTSRQQQASARTNVRHAVRIQSEREKPSG
jgi:hypothetical protein